MSEVELSVGDELKLVIKGASKFIIIAIPILAYALVLVLYHPADLQALISYSGLLFIFLVYAVRVMERQRRKFGRLIH